MCTIQKKSGFTLIELLVVISIISLLSSVLLASLNSARDKAKVSAISSFNASVYHGLGDQLIAWWKFDEGSNTTAADTSGNSYTATLTYAATWVTGQVGPYAVNTATGNYASQLTVNSVPLGATWTASWWSYFPLSSSSGGWRTMFRSFTNGGDHQVIVDVNGDLGMYDNDLGTGFNSSGYNINSLTGWHLVTATYTNNVTTFYIDAKIVGSATRQNTDNIDVIGNYQGGSQNWGIIDDLRIYSKVITSDYIQEIYAMTAPKYLGRK
ncbi:MAG: LamG-like jellyroll fold domain-containing protein [Candidatus Taylorbacteria bacterium]